MTLIFTHTIVFFTKFNRTFTTIFVSHLTNTFLKQSATCDTIIVVLLHQIFLLLSKSHGFFLYIPLLLDCCCNSIPFTVWLTSWYHFLLLPSFAVVQWRLGPRWCSVEHLPGERPSLLLVSPSFMSFIENLWFDITHMFWELVSLKLYNHRHFYRDAISRKVTNHS